MMLNFLFIASILLFSSSSIIFLCSSFTCCLHVGQFSRLVILVFRSSACSFFVFNDVISFRSYCVSFSKCWFFSCFILICVSTFSSACSCFISVSVWVICSVNFSNSFSTSIFCFSFVPCSIFLISSCFLISINSLIWFSIVSISCFFFSKSCLNSSVLG